MSRSKSAFSNPWPSFSRPSVLDIFSSISLGPKSEQTHAELQVVFPKFDLHATAVQVAWLGHASVYILLPHTTGPIGILFDPIFSKRCSPIPWLGPKRHLPPPCGVRDLPGLQYVVISHDHYDHLDKGSIRDIERYQRDVRYMVPTGLAVWMEKVGVDPCRVTELGWWEDWICGYPNETSPGTTDLEPSSASNGTAGATDIPSPPAALPPRRLGSHLASSQSTLVGDGEILFGADQDRVELTEETKISGNITVGSGRSSVTTASQGSRLRFTCTPAQHNSGRGLTKRNKTLWASWYVQWDVPGSDPFGAFFGGDTGYRSQDTGPACPIFREIAARLGPPDIAFLPIAAGSILPFLERLFRVKLDHGKLTSSIHCAPKDAVAIHHVMRSRLSVGIHWGTFTTAQHASETVRALEEACKGDEMGLEGKGRGRLFQVVNIGSVFSV